MVLVLHGERFFYFSQVRLSWSARTERTPSVEASAEVYKSFPFQSLSPLEYYQGPLVLYQRSLDLDSYTVQLTQKVQRDTKTSAVNDKYRWY